MDEAIILSMTKDALGIKSDARNTRLSAIIGGVIRELEDEKGLVLDGANPYHLLFVTDLAAWRFENKEPQAGLPRNLQFRLHNLIIHVGSGSLQVNNIKYVSILPATPDSQTVYILPDGTKNMYINGDWTVVRLSNGSWVI